MQSRDISLTGAVQQKWRTDGSPELTWAELLERTIAADVQLERRGLNPAPKFRKLRYNNDQSRMYQWGEDVGTRFGDRQQNVILGWNGWRLLSLPGKKFISRDWIRTNLIKNDLLAQAFMNWFPSRKT
jgi:hypothetical protein